MFSDPIEARLARIARRRAGVCTADEAYAVGIGRSSLQRRAKDGRLVAQHRGVYAIGGTPLSAEARHAVALLRAGRGAIFSHDTAAERTKLWNPERGDGLLHVLGCPGPSIGRDGDVVFHCTNSLPAAHITLVDGAHMTTPTRTICDLGATRTPHQIAAVMREANFRRVLDLAAVGDLLTARHGRNGSARVRRAVDLYRAGSAGTRSRTEDFLLERLLSAPLPEPSVNVRGITGLRGIEPDLAWIERRLVVELDGSPHTAPGVREGDAQRDAVLRDAGWQVLRFTAGDVWTRRAAVIRCIVAAHSGA